MPLHVPTPYENVHGLSQEKLRAEVAFAHLKLRATAVLEPRDVRKAQAELAAATEALDPVSKAKARPAPPNPDANAPIAAYDQSGNLVGQVAPAKFRKFEDGAKTGDTVVFDQGGKVIGFAAPKDIKAMASAPTAAKPAVPAAAAPVAAAPAAPPASPASPTNGPAPVRKSVTLREKWAAERVLKSLAAVAQRPRASQAQRHAAARKERHRLERLNV